MNVYNNAKSVSADKLHFRAAAAATNLKHLMARKNGTAPVNTANQQCHESLLLCRCPACSDNHKDWHSSGCLLDSIDNWASKDFE